LGLRDAEDADIFLAAKQAGAIVITKDRDFVDLLDRFGAPPKIIWLTCGNTSNERLKQIFTTHLSAALEILAKGDNFVEILLVVLSNLAFAVRARSIKNATAREFN